MSKIERYGDIKEFEHLRRMQLNDIDEYGETASLAYKGYPLFEWTMPDVSFLPYAGERCVFFSPIFNFADAAISCGIIALILFYGKYLGDIMENHK